MAGHVGDGTGDPDGSRVDSLGSWTRAVNGAAASPTGSRAIQGLEEMLAEHRATDLARGAAVERDRARIMQKRRAKADAKEAKYEAAVANDRDVAAAAKTVSTAARKANFKQEEETRSDKQAAMTSSSSTAV